MVSSLDGDNWTVTYNCDASYAIKWADGRGERIFVYVYTVTKRGDERVKAEVSYTIKVSFAPSGNRRMGPVAKFEPEKDTFSSQ
jgi:hypothetical protein